MYIMNDGVHEPKAYCRTTPRSIMAEDWRLPRVGTAEDPLRLAVFISGSGSGMEALLKHQQAPGCKHTTTVVISDKPNVSGLNKAENLGVTAVVVPLPDVSDKAERRLFHEQEIGEVLADYGAETIILSGYMRILTPSFVCLLYTSPSPRDS